MNKTWYKSRGIWLGLITSLIGTLEVVRTAVDTDDWSTAGIIVMVMGILKIWERYTRK